MKAITSDEMRELEKSAIGMGIPGRVLMETAGMKVSNIALHETKYPKNATVICGMGGNGGDGLVCSRYLHEAGLNVSVFLVQPEDAIRSEDAAANLRVLKNLGLKIIVINDANLNMLKETLIGSNIVIDAIYGLGFKGEMPGLIGTIIDMINKTKLEVKDKLPYSVISVDVPSGADATTGKVASPCIEADITVTFEYPKIGLLKYPASNYAGKILTTSIGIPKSAHAGDQIPRMSQDNIVDPGTKGIQITDSKFVSSQLPRWKADTHKGSRGKVLIIAGSSGMMGAAVLSSNAAMRVGAGLVVLCVPSDIKNEVNSMSLEVVVSTLNEIKANITDCDVIAIGPGLSKGKTVRDIVTSILSSKDIKVPLILDADALNAIKDPSMLSRSGLDIIITPHPGEFSRLTKRSVDEIQKDRMGTASSFAVKYGVTVVLKGAYTVIAGKDGKIFINPVANPAMASAGVGDVLTGIIAGLAGQGLSSYNAAVSGAYIHGLSGNMASSIKGRYHIIASDIIESIPYALDTLL